MKKTDSLPRASSPESLGISSEQIIAFLNDIEEHKLELHSFMLIRHGQIAAECYWKPFAAQYAHTMFSGSKSVTSTAIGFCINEGLLSLDTKVYSIFPEYVPLRLGRFARELNVEHLLTMTSGKLASFIFDTESAGWVEKYLKAPFVNEPGTKFNYASENSYMLAAIVKKVTGKTVLEYLRPRLFEPLGIKMPVWETDSSGTEAGGWGLYLRTEDFAKFILCYLKGGRYNGAQVIPEFWAKTVGQPHVPKTPGIAHDHSSGYGYQFWRNSFPNSWRCDGVFSQLAIAIPDYDCCIVTTGGEPMEKEVLEAIWRHFPTRFREGPIREDPELLAELKQKTSTLSLPLLKAAPRRTEIEQRINGKYIKYQKNKAATVLTAAGNFIRSKRSGQFNNVKMEFLPEYMNFHWTERYNDMDIRVGYDGRYCLNDVNIAGTPFTIAATCAWIENGSFEVWIRPLQHAQVKKLRFRFTGNMVYTENWSEKTLYEMGVFFLDFKGIKTDFALKNIMKGAAAVVEPIVDPEMIGFVYTPEKL